MRATRYIAAALLAIAAGCGGQTGVIAIRLVAAPDSDLLSRIERVHAVLSEPLTEVDAVRGADGQLRLDLEIPAEDGSAFLVVEVFDADGERIAIARSGPLPITAVNAVVTMYAAPPLSFAEAPVALDPPRSEIGAALLPYGAILLGGRDAGGQPSDQVVVYNVYDHDLQEGAPLPEARAAATAVAGDIGRVYLFGGLDADGTTRGDGWFFDTGVAPAGVYGELAIEGDLARAGAAGVAVGNETFLVTGAPAVQVNGATSRVKEWPDAPPLADGAAARLTADDSGATEVLVAGLGVGETGAVVYDGDAYRDVSAPDEVRRSGHAVVALPGGRALVVGGALDTGEPAGSALVYDPADDELAVLGDFLATPRTEAAIAATSHHVIVAGGVDAGGAVSGDAEVFDAATLDPVATLPLVVPRRGAAALPMSNGQVLVAGGVDADGEPVGLLELFTPDS